MYIINPINISYSFLPPSFEYSESRIYIYGLGMTTNKHYGAFIDVKIEK